MSEARRPLDQKRWMTGNETATSVSPSVLVQAIHRGWPTAAAAGRDLVQERVMPQLLPVSATRGRAFRARLFAKLYSHAQPHMPSIFLSHRAFHISSFQHTVYYLFPYGAPSSQLVEVSSNRQNERTNSIYLRPLRFPRLQRVSKADGRMRA